MHHLSIDIETYSEVPLDKSGLYKYATDDSFEVLLIAWSYDGMPVEIVDLARGEDLPDRLRLALLDGDTIKHAYNASFEWFCLSQHFKFKDAENWLPQWQCTMLHGLYCGYTKGLAAMGEALGLPQDKKKMGIGASLIRTFCVPCKPTRSNGNRTRIYPDMEPQKWELFKEYCMRDVVTEMTIENRLSAFPVPDSEQKLWQLDQIINARGVRIDTELVQGALDVHKYVTDNLRSEASELTGLDNPNSVSQLITWYEEETGETLENLRKDTVKDLLGDDSSKDIVKRVLKIRQELGKTSVKKYEAMTKSVCADGRIRGLLQFYGANRTGRWAGRLVQVQNLPRNYIETLSYARELVKSRDADMIKLVYGSVPDTLSQLIRTAFIPSEGNVFLVADFSAIEARVISWLAGETWRQEVFATHGKIYEASASQMFGVPIEKIKKGNPEYALRSKGKVAELALGYQGGSGALIQMGALAMGLSEDELPEIVQRWRNSNKRIVDLWYSVENAAIECIRTGKPQHVRNMITFRREYDRGTDQDFLTVQLPSQRKLFYTRPTLTTNKWGNDSIAYQGMNQKTKKFTTLETYGGKLTENIIQAIARDCLAVTMTRLESSGYKIVFHVHDECIIDAPKGAALEDACAIMGQPIPWAPGLLLRADGFKSEFYKKD